MLQLRRWTGFVSIWDYRLLVCSSHCVHSCGRSGYLQPSACLLHNNLSPLSVKCPVPSRSVTSPQPSLMLPIYALKSSIDPIILRSMPICSSSIIAVHDSFSFRGVIFALSQLTCAYTVLILCTYTTGKFLIKDTLSVIWNCKILHFRYTTFGGWKCVSAHKISSKWDKSW